MTTSVSLTMQKISPLRNFSPSYPDGRKILRKSKILKNGDETGHVTWNWRYYGLVRTSLYRWKAVLEKHGEVAVVRKKRRRSLGNANLMRTLLDSLKIPPFLQWKGPLTRHSERRCKATTDRLARTSFSYLLRIDWIKDPYADENGVEPVATLIEQNGIHGLDLHLLISCMTTPTIADRRTSHKDAVRSAGLNN